MLPHWPLLNVSRCEVFKTTKIEVCYGSSKLQTQLFLKATGDQPQVKKYTPLSPSWLSPRQKSLVLTSEVHDHF